MRSIPLKMGKGLLITPRLTMATDVPAPNSSVEPDARLNAVHTQREIGIPVRHELIERSRAACARAKEVRLRAERLVARTEAISPAPGYEFESRVRRPSDLPALGGLCGKSARP
jgi:hypothetical protein